MDEYMKSNQILWDQKAKAHFHTEFYDLAGFKAGKSSLYPIELDEIAGEVAGKDLLHLQCHFGMDTLSLARLGAICTGVDFSGEAIRQAQALNAELGMNCTFIQSNIYDLQKNLAGRFDIVYTTYGVLAWLPDLSRWAEVIAHFLRPGGVFFIAEVHPFANAMDDERQDAEMVVRYPYFSQPEPLVFTPVGSYADPQANIDHPVDYEWPYGLGDVLNALISAGLRIEYLHEFNYTVFQHFPFLEQRGRLYHLPERMPRLPLLFSLRAVKA